jgi:surfeit locus 1 family protein
MTGRQAGLLLTGLLGTVVLVGLGVWQVQRMHWKAQILSQIEARIGSVPMRLVEQVTPDTDQYMPTRQRGVLTGKEVHVLSSHPAQGTGYRVIAALGQTDDGRDIMVDLGFVPDADLNAPRPTGEIDVRGNLLWPDDSDAYTPPPDLDKNLWFARDVAAMAETLGTEPILIVASEIAPPIPGFTQMPVNTASIPNNHLQYAITWFSLAAIWAGMTLFSLRRIRRGT